MNCEIRLRIFENSDCLMGPGIATLLEETAKLGSVTAAAQKMELSTTKAWKIIRKTEKAAGKALITTKSGGIGGGGTNLTPYAEEILRVFRTIESEILTSADKKLSEFFSYQPSAEQKIAKRNKVQDKSENS